MVGTFHHFTFSFQEVRPAIDEILDFIQSPELEKEHPASVFMDKIWSELNELESISGGYIIRKIDHLHLKEGILEVEGNRLSIDRQLAGYLKKASHAAIFICTAGKEFTDKTRILNDEGNFLEAYILDSIGSLTVENAMNNIQNSLAEEMNGLGMKISNRYSPGYCNWALSEQKMLFSLIGENSIGITLNDSCLMYPTKSVSGIIGIGENIKKREYGCKICNNQTCIYRKISHEKN